MKQLCGGTWPEEDITKKIHVIVAMKQVKRELERASSYADYFRGADLRRTTIVICLRMSRQLLASLSLLRKSLFLDYDVKASAPTFSSSPAFPTRSLSLS